MIYSTGLPCQICGLERASPCEGIIDYNYRLNRLKIDYVLVAKES
jgi:hypothetical protein